MKKHFVTFYSPGTFVSEASIKEIEGWDVSKASKMAKTIKERYNATPYGFRFSTNRRKSDELDSQVIKQSGMYFLGGIIHTLEDIKARNDPKDKILIDNMEVNGYNKVIENTNSYRIVLPFNEGDILLEDD